jgi:hypothetical protein
LSGESGLIAAANKFSIKINFAIGDIFGIEGFGSRFAYEK